VFFSEDTKKINTDWTTIRKSLDHRPLNTETQAYKKFLLNTLENIETFANKYPQIHCEKEFKQVVSLIEKVNNI
jgi:hypothetical protein